MKPFLNFTAALWLIISMLMAGFLFPKNIALAEGANMCQVDVDVILVLDVSGSMEDGGSQSQCNWKELEWVDSSMQCVGHSQDSLSEEECLAKPDTIQCGSPAYTAPAPSKIESAKAAAKSFLDNLKSQDQSGLITFSDTAQLAKSLSSDHNVTKTAIDSIDSAVTGGATNIGDAISFAIAEFNGNANLQAAKTIILLTDGKANRPNGLGSGEDSDDVAYAIQKATEAGNLGYKIFTIGLGSNSDINETMLQDIADITGADYHHASNGDGLEGIYQEISTDICQYASISGYKYNDLNNNGEIDDGEEALHGWEIVLSGDASATQTTDENGFYAFAGLEAGSYTISETNQNGWLQTYPSEGFYALTLSQGENSTEKDFANYFSVCGNEILDESEQCDDGNTSNGDGCSSTCQTETPANPEDYNNQEDCENAGFYWYNNSCHELPYVPPQPEDYNNQEDCESAGFYWYDDSCHADPQPEEPVCGNSAVESDEQCDDGNTSGGDGCSSTCQTEQTSGNGAGIMGVNYYSTILASHGEGGSMTPLGEVHVQFLSSQFFSIEPSKAYKIKDVLVDGISIGPVDSYFFEHVTGNHTISAAFSVAKIGDINRDGNVDDQDLALMLSVWGQTDSSMPADLNNDGKIDEYDMAILMLHWGE